MWARRPEGKFQVGGGDIGEFFVKVIATGGHDGVRFFTGQGEDHGDIMGGEGPEDIFFPTDFA